MSKLTCANCGRVLKWKNEAIKIIMKTGGYQTVCVGCALERATEKGGG